MNYRQTQNFYNSSRLPYEVSKYQKISLLTPKGSSNFGNINFLFFFFHIPAFFGKTEKWSSPQNYSHYYRFFSVHSCRSSKSEKKVKIVFCLSIFYSWHHRNNKWNKKYSFTGPLGFKSQRVGYQSNQKLLYHYQHSRNQLNSEICS